MSTRIDEYPLESPTDGAAAIGLNSSGNTRRLSLGTAAEANVTTSSTDTTAGRVMKVGDFGLGGDVATDLGTITDIEDLSSYIDESAGGQQGYLTFSGVEGIPDSQYAAIVWPRASRGVVWFHTNTNNDIFYTSREAAGWQPVRKLYHSGNYPSDSAWTTTTSLDNGWTGSVCYIKRAGMVTVSYDLDGTSASANDPITLPSAYRIGVSTWMPAGRGNGDVPIRVSLSTSGRVDIYGTGNSIVQGAFTYPVL